MIKWGGIELDIGVICACMPSMPGAFRPLVRRIKAALGITTGDDTTNGYVNNYNNSGGSSSRYANITAISSSKKHHHYAPSPPGSFHSHARGGSNIQMTTTLHQTRVHNVSEGELPLHDPSSDMGSSGPRTVTAQAWA